MFLGDDGKYYFDKSKTIVLDDDCYKEIYNSAIKNLKSKKVIDNKVFTIIRGAHLTIINEENKETELTYSPANIIFIGKKNVEKLSIYSFEQFQKALDFFQISFPYSDNILLSKSNIKSLIYDSKSYNEPILIEDINVFEKDFSNEPNELCKLEDLSEYICYYLKSELNLGQYPENKFLNENDFILKKKDKFDYYMKEERENKFLSFVAKCKESKEYFFTGNVSIGKTFTLLGLVNIKINKVRKAYFNLETLQKRKEYFKIIAYESRNLFQDKENWKNAFHKIEEKDLKSPLSMILSIIEEISLKEDQEMMHIFIIDQIKFDDINHDRIFEEMNNIRNYIKNTTNCYLIGCLSINYKGIKQILFYNWFKEKDFKNDIDIPIVKLIELDDKDIDQKNKYLKLLGNLPRYKNMKDKLNIKIINVIVKKIKEKIKKFYGYKELLTFKTLENIPIKTKIENLSQFADLLKKIPFKYFKIDLQNKMIDYSFPLVKTAISELLHSYQVKNYTGNTFAEFDWYIERRVIDLIKTSHCLGEYYIDNSYEIPSIYFDYKIEDELFEPSENSFFYFSYFNVRRYDCAIYFGEQKSILLIQIATKRTKEQLEKYNKDNFQKDLTLMQKFFDKNKIEINKYYLLFIITLQNIDNEKKIKLIFNQSGLKYFIYDLSEDKFKDSSFTKYEISYYKNPHLINDEEKEIIYFYLENNSFIFKNSKSALKCYIEVGTSLVEFIELFLNEQLAKKLIKDYHFKESHYHLRYTRCCIQGEKILDMELIDNLEVLFLNYEENKVYIGKGIIDNNIAILTFETYELTLGNAFRNQIISIPSDMQGFIFTGKISKDIK